MSELYLIALRPEVVDAGISMSTSTGTVIIDEYDIVIAGSEPCSTSYSCYWPSFCDPRTLLTSMTGGTTAC
jgi:hypothetical protein